MFQRIEAWAKRLKQDAVMLWFAKDHQDTPALAKAPAVLYDSRNQIEPEFAPDAVRRCVACNHG